MAMMKNASAQLNMTDSLRMWVAAQTGRANSMPDPAAKFSAPKDVTLAATL
jgi:hypothetical protein